MSHNLFLQSSLLVTDDLKLLKKVCAEENGLTLEELENDYDRNNEDFCIAEYHLKALGQLTIKKDLFKERSPDAVMLITSKLPVSMGMYFKGIKKK